MTPATGRDVSLASPGRRILHLHTVVIGALLHIHGTRIGRSGKDLPRCPVLLANAAYEAQSLHDTHTLNRFRISSLCLYARIVRTAGQHGEGGRSFFDLLPGESCPVLPEDSEAQSNIFSPVTRNLLAHTVALTEQTSQNIQPSFQAHRAERPGDQRPASILLP